jgi:heat shock protein HslJ
MKNKFFILFPLIALVLSACSSGQTSPAGEWELITYGEAKDPASALPNVNTSINFDENGEFHGNVGCNILRGTYEMGEDQVMIKQIVSTRKYCRDIAEQENGVLGIISDAALHFQMDGDQLTLTSVDEMSVIVLRRK